MSITSFKLADGSKPIPWFSFGTVFAEGTSPAEFLPIGRKAVEAGLLGIDCAQLYHTEKEVGQIVRESGRPRDDFFLTTKLSNPDEKDPTPDTETIAVADVRASVLGSLERLGTQPDLLFLHNPFVVPRGQLKPFWQVLEKMKDDGELTASLAVSNWRMKDYDELLSFAKYKPVVNQLEFHPFLLTDLDEIMELQKAHGIVTMAYGPLSPLLRHPSKGGPLKPILARIGERLGLEPASVLLLWFKAKGVVPVTSTTKAERLAAMGELARSEASLTADEVAEIDAVGRKIHYRAYDHHMMFDHHKTDLPVDL